MASLNSIYIKTETLKTLFDTISKKGEKGIELTISINDTENEYGQNLTAYVSQTKEQRDDKKPKFYVGNGKTFWTDGKIEIAKKVETVHEAKPIQEENPDDLLF